MLSVQHLWIIFIIISTRNKYPLYILLLWSMHIWFIHVFKVIRLRCCHTVHFLSKLRLRYVVYFTLYYKNNLCICIWLQKIIFIMFVLKVVIFRTLSLSTTHEDAVLTAQGNSNGAACHLPFLRSGKLYWSCTTDTSPNNVWCATTYDFDTDGKWGYCLIEGRCHICKQILIFKSTKV